jgi:hypothetical protein
LNPLQDASGGKKISINDLVIKVIPAPSLDSRVVSLVKPRFVKFDACISLFLLFVGFIIGCAYSVYCGMYSIYLLLLSKVLNLSLFKCRLQLWLFERSLSVTAHG